MAFCWILILALVVSNVSAEFVWSNTEETLKSRTLIYEEKDDKNFLDLKNCMSFCEIDIKCRGFVFDEKSCQFFKDGPERDTEKSSSSKMYHLDNYESEKYLQCLPRFYPVGLSSIPSGSWSDDEKDKCMKKCLNDSLCLGFYIKLYGSKEKCLTFRTPSNDHLHYSPKVHATVIKYILQDSCHRVCRHKWTLTKPMSDRGEELPYDHDQCLRYCSNHYDCIGVVLSSSNKCYRPGATGRSLTLPRTELTIDRCWTSCAVYFIKYHEKVVSRKHSEHVRRITKNAFQCQELCRRDPLCKLYEVINGDPWSIDEQSVSCQLLYKDVTQSLETDPIGSVGVKIYSPCTTDKYQPYQPIFLGNIQLQSDKMILKQLLLPTIESCYDECMRDLSCIGFDAELSQSKILSNGDSLLMSETVKDCYLLLDSAGYVYYVSNLNHVSVLKQESQQREVLRGLI